MKTCKKCGNVFDDATVVCPQCGEKVELNSSDKMKDAFNKLNDTEDSTKDFDVNDIKDNKGLTILAYISWLVLVPLFARKESKFARYHANQGLTLAIIESIIYITQFITLAILAPIKPIQVIFAILFYTVDLACVGLAVIGIVNVAKGKAKKLPLIGNFTILK